MKLKSRRPAISPTKKRVKRKIEKQKTTKDSSSSIRPAAQKTRKLNPPPNLVNRNKTNSRQESSNEEERDTQEEYYEKNEIMKQKRSPQPAAIPTKNRFEALQAQEPSSSQLQETQNTIIESIKKKDDILRKKANRQPTSLVTLPETRNKNKDEQTITSLAASMKKATSQAQPMQTDKPKGLSPPTTSLKGQTHKGLPISHPAEDHADALASAKGARLPPNQHNPSGPERHDRPHGKFSQN